MNYNNDDWYAEYDQMRDLNPYYIYEQEMECPPEEINYETHHYQHLQIPEPLGPLSIANCIPVVARFKSFGMLIFDWNLTGAVRVQADFINTTTIISQVKSIFHLLMFNKSKAFMVQQQYFQYLGAISNAMPMIGYPKAILHILLCDFKNAHYAFHSSTKTACFLIGGYCGYTYWPNLGIVSTTVGAVLAGTVVDAVIAPDDRPTFPPDLFKKMFEFLDGFPSLAIRIDWIQYEPAGAFEGIVDGLIDIFSITGLWSTVLSLSLLVYTDRFYVYE